MQLVVERTYIVPGMTCEHCRTAVAEEVERVDGVQSAEVDLEAKLVTARGTKVDDVAVREAIANAGYKVA